MADFLNSAMPALAVLVAVIAGLILSWLVRLLVTRLNRRVGAAEEATRVGRLPLRFTLCLIGIRVAFGLTTGPGDWRNNVDHALLIALILSLGWLAVAVILIVEAAMLSRYRTDVTDNRRARRLRTQVSLTRRLAVALVAVIALGCVLLTFPDVRALGTGLLASAGLLSVVAGLAVQTSLVNVFAGMQLAFTDAIRVDDVVVVQKEWGRIEEITLTYVVVHIWDDRRLILPSSYFTTTPFENWTRHQAAVMGTVELDLDWRAPVEAMRTELREILDASELWDERVGILQITDAVAGFVRVRVLVSAADSGSLFDLRCLVREDLITFLQVDHPEALPHTRWEALDASPVAGPVAGTEGKTVASAGSPAPTKGTADDDGGTRPPSSRRSGADRDRTAVLPTVTRKSGAGGAQLFTGSIEAVERSRLFTGPGQRAYDDRQRELDREEDQGGA